VGVLKKKTLRAGKRGAGKKDSFSSPMREGKSKKDLLPLQKKSAREIFAKLGGMYRRERARSLLAKDEGGKKRKRGFNTGTKRQRLPLAMQYVWGGGKKGFSALLLKRGEKKKESGHQSPARLSEGEETKTLRIRK